MINFIDESIYRLIFRLYSVKTTFIMTVVSHIGSAIFFILLCVMLFILLKNKKIALLVSLNLAVVYLINVIIKIIIARPRPGGLRLVYETGYSFPSGHAMVATGFYGFLIYITNKKISNKKLKSIITIFLSLLILLIGISRVYLGVHYATDIIGAFIIGIVYLIIYIKIVNKKSNILEKS